MSRQPMPAGWYWEWSVKPRDGQRGEGEWKQDRLAELEHWAGLHPQKMHGERLRKLLAVREEYAIAERIIVALLGGGEQTERELRQWLAEGGVSERTAYDALRRLQKAGTILRDWAVGEYGLTWYALTRREDSGGQRAARDGDGPRTDAGAGCGDSAGGGGDGEGWFGWNGFGEAVLSGVD